MTLVAAPIVELTARPLLEQVLAAATDGIRGPGGDPFETEVVRRDNHVEVTYRLQRTTLCTRHLRVDERARIVTLLELDLPKWWYDGTELHVQFVANLATYLQVPCTLAAMVGPPRGRVWAAHFGWSPGLDNANAAAVRAAVEAVTPTPADDEDLPWGGADLPARVQLLAGPDPRTADGAGSWRHLIRTLGPADLVSALDDLHPGLAEVVFAHMPTWFGGVTVDPVAASVAGD